MLPCAPFKTVVTLTASSVGNMIRLGAAALRRAPRKRMAVALLAGLAGAGALAGASLAQPVGGPKGGNDRVMAFDTDVFRVSLRGGEVTRIIVDGDGDTDLDLFVYDENGNLIASDEDETDYCVCRVTPKWSGTFRIEIRNYGGVYNRYRIDLD